MRLERIDGDEYGARRRQASVLAVARPTRAALGLVRTAAKAVVMWRRRTRERRELLSLDERDLRDIGLSRYDALREGRKRFWQA